VQEIGGLKQYMVEEWETISDHGENFNMLNEKYM